MLRYAEPTKGIFGKWQYWISTVVVASVFGIIFNLLDQRLFFSPVVAFYIPKDGLADFMLSTIIAILLGIVISMNIWYFMNRNRSIKNKRITSATSILPATLIVISSVCIGCSLSMGTLVMSVFGTAGATALSFLSFYHVPIRILSIGLLMWSCYMLNRKLAVKGCQPDILRND